MGMRHPDRPCMNRTAHPGGCGPDTRSPDEKARDPYDTQNPVSQKAGACLMPSGSTECMTLIERYEAGDRSNAVVKAIVQQRSRQARQAGQEKEKALAKAAKAAAKAARREACIARGGMWRDANERCCPKGGFC